jgi:hypothetical protein
MPWRAAVAITLATASAVAMAEGAATIHPSGPSVPENLLRIEVRLATPLRGPLDMSRVRLLDEQGREIAEPFLDLALTSADGRRMALLLHPGRVKTGVGANLALGRALHAGRAVTLVIDDPAVGRELRKSWQVLAAETEGPVPSHWVLNQPVAGTRTPLVVRLQAPISAASDGLIAVRQLGGRRARGRIRLSEGETVWTFKPAERWRTGTYALVTHPDLETPSGNRICARFEQVGASRAECRAGAIVLFDVSQR